jgi:hypothetical protein
MRAETLVDGLDVGRGAAVCNDEGRRGEGTAERNPLPDPPPLAGEGDERAGEGEGYCYLAASA